MYHITFRASGKDGRGSATSSEASDVSQQQPRKMTFMEQVNKRKGIYIMFDYISNHRCTNANLIVKTCALYYRL